MVRPADRAGSNKHTGRMSVLWPGGVGAGSYVRWHPDWTAIVPHRAQADSPASLTVRLGLAWKPQYRYSSFISHTPVGFLGYSPSSTMVGKAHCITKSRCLGL